MQHARPNRLRRAVAYAVLAAVLGLVSLTLTQCTLVGDSLTGVTIDRSAPTSCAQQCQVAYVEGNKAEQKRHQEAIEACQALSGDAKGACLVAEDAEHNSRKAALDAARTECQTNCHRQGTGSAG